MKEFKSKACRRKQLAGVLKALAACRNFWGCATMDRRPANPSPPRQQCRCGGAPASKLHVPANSAVEENTRTAAAPRSRETSELETNTGRYEGRRDSGARKWCFTGALRCQRVLKPFCGGKIYAASSKTFSTLWDAGGLFGSFLGCSIAIGKTTPFLGQILRIQIFLWHKRHPYKKQVKFGKSRLTIGTHGYHSLAQQMTMFANACK